MFEKDTSKLYYTRDILTMSEKIYEAYMDMRKAVNTVEKYKWDNNDKYTNNEDFKQGFIAGVKAMSSIFMDL